MNDEVKEPTEQIDGEFKKPLFIRLQEGLNDPDVLRNIRTTIILIIALGAPILYFGFIENMSFEGLFTWKLGFLAVMSIASVKMVQIDTKIRAFEDEIMNNINLNKVEKQIYEENKKTKNHYLGHKWVNKYNDEQQKTADETATEKKRNKLNYKKATLEIKGKFNTRAYKNIVKQIKHLETNNVRGKYKPIEYNDVHTMDKSGKNSGAQAKKTLNYNPKKENVISTTLSIFIKGATMGGAGSIPFLWNQDWRVVILFYLTFIFSLLLTIFQTYIKTRRKTEKKYLPAREFKLDLLHDMNKYIAENELKEAPKPKEAVVVAKEPQNQPQEIPKEEQKEDKIIVPPVTPEQIDEQIKKENKEVTPLWPKLPAH